MECGRRSFDSMSACTATSDHQAPSLLLPVYTYTSHTIKPRHNHPSLPLSLPQNNPSHNPNPLTSQTSSHSPHHHKADHKDSHHPLPLQSLHSPPPPSKPPQPDSQPDSHPKA